jgi:3-isopropylmalate/(R)-2-methylmalate dehydratase large subunit
MSVEGGAKAGFIAPDEKAYAYLKDKPKAPKSKAWDEAMRYWESLRSDDGAHFDREIRLRCGETAAAGHLGHQPRAGDVDPPAKCRCRRKLPMKRKRIAAERSLEYMGLKGGEKMTDLKLDRVFIGSCTNARIEDLRAVARVVEGKTVNANVNAMIVPGSGLVRCRRKRKASTRFSKPLVSRGASRAARCALR